MKNKLLRAICYIIALAIGIMAIIYLVAWKSPKYLKVDTAPVAAIIPFARYDSISDHPRPLILEKQSVVIFGATHTKDPNHPEIVQIEQKWQQLKPTVALVEGRLGFLFPGLMNPVKTLGEGGKVKELASKDGVPVYNWDLSKEELAKSLQPRFSKEQIALQQILNPYFGNLRHGKPADPEAFVAGYLSRAANVGLQDEIKTVADVDRIWKKYFPTQDWRNTSDEYELPGFLADIMSYTNDIRNEKLVATINALKAKGERVFVVCGSSHAACIQHAVD